MLVLPRPQKVTSQPQVGHRSATSQPQVSQNPKFCDSYTLSRALPPTLEPRHSADPGAPPCRRPWNPAIPLTLEPRPPADPTLQKVDLNENLTPQVPKTPFWSSF